MLRPVKGKKVVHFKRKQRTMCLSGMTITDIHMKLDKYIEDNTKKSAEYGILSEEKVFVDNLSFSYQTDQIHGTNTLGLFLNVEQSVKAVAILHDEIWMLVNDDYPEDDYPDIVDVKYFEGGWM